jgi:cyclopropane fatty-acyl-phospholipid synthase-like methyltransferase
LLEIGCNEGRGLRIYKKNGFEVEGLEINERAASEARKGGFKVYTEPLEDFQPEEPYDVIVLSNVLEHSLRPKQMLKNVGRILKPDGKVWISCPNVDSWQCELFGRYWINWHVPFHIVHFSKGTLIDMLQKCGFKIQSTGQASPALWLTQSLISLLLAKPGNPTRQLRNPLLVASLMVLVRGLLFSVLWLGNRLGRGDCLVIVATKV